MKLTLPVFNLGSPKQINAATDIRQKYLAKALEASLPLESLQDLLTVRCVAKWWLDNSKKITVENSPRLFSAVKGQITRHGSAEAAGENSIDRAYQEQQKAMEYYLNSIPMYKH